jgi:S-disulfanyl-L-cysteine oxidoreductase SoxD
MLITILAAAVAAALAQEPNRSVWDGIYTEEQANRGEPLYAKHCGACHGKSLEGIEMAPALMGGDFLDKWSGQTVGDLFERMRTTMPLNQPGGLSRDVNVEITAYMLRVNGFPAASKALPRETAAMKLIRIEAKKSN